MSKIALVTGAGSGIGRATAIALMDAGYTVVLTGRRADPLSETLELATGGDGLAVPADITDPAAVDRLFAAIKDKYGRLDLLFNNAGSNVPETAIDALTYDQWSSVIDVNITGTFLCAQGAFRLMKDQNPQGGRIINNGSISARLPRPDSVPYTMSKHAITGLTKCLALDGRAYGIASGQIDIGNAATAMAARMQTGVRQADGSMAVEPVMDVKQVAAAVVHMADLPLATNVPFMTIMATNMPLFGRG